MGREELTSLRRFVLNDKLQLMIKHEIINNPEFFLGRISLLKRTLDFILVKNISISYLIYQFSDKI